MIPVTLQPEPKDFNARVRSRGHKWLADHGIPLDAAPPPGVKLPPYWSYSNRQLWEAYSGVCAYLAIFFEWRTGASSTDHCIAKSRNAGAAYEWSNFRLSCLGANRNKSVSNEVLDPIGLRKNTFYINFASGMMYVNASHDDEYKKLAEKTIKILRLNDPDMCRMRVQHYSEYLEGMCSLDFLRRKSPFVYEELLRQGLW